jgi:acyl carrier protein
MVDKLNDAELLEQIKPILKQVIPRYASSDNISPETRLLEDLSIDSARLVDLVLSLEDAFHLSIEDGVIDTVKTVGGLVALIRG